jgi:Flp pilus assembly protein TadD
MAPKKAEKKAAVTPEAKAAAAAAKSEGNTFFAAGQFQEALAQFTIAIENDPSDHIFFSNRR